MDGLSGAASGMAVVSLTFQLADSIKKLCEFWDSVHDAPNDIHAILEDLRLLSAVLESIQLNELRYGPDPVTRSVLESCGGKVIALIGLVDDLEPGFTSRSKRVRKWSAIKATLRSEKIKKFRDSLEETKINLILARQSSSDRATGINFDRIDTQQRKILEITQNIAGLQMQQSSRTVTTVSSGPAGIDGHIDDLRAESRRISYLVANPILRSGFEMGVNNAYEGLKTHLEGQPSMKSHGPAKHPGFSKQKVSVTEICDNPEDSAALVRGKSAGTISTNKRPNHKRSRFRYEVDEYSSVTENMLGKISFTTKTFHLRSRRSADLDARPSDDQYEFETSFTLHPAPWLIRCGVNFGLRVAVARSTQGWKQNLESYRAVPDDSEIFRSCLSGDLGAVRSLFSSGMASPFDTNSRGSTPLHYAAGYYHLQLCELLIDMGADRHAREIGPENETPLESTGDRELVRHSAAVEDAFAVIRLLGDDVIDFSEEDSIGWKILGRIASKRDVGLMARALEYFQTDIKQNDNEHHTAYWLERFSLKAILGGKQVVAAILTPNSSVVDATSPDNGYSALHNVLSSAGHVLSAEHASMIKSLILSGASLHLTSRSSSAKSETPTSLAIQHSYRFFQWRKLLVELGKDLEVFVEEELQQSPLVIAGWEQDTLLALFTFQFEPHGSGVGERCAKCHGAFFNKSFREFWWEKLLQRIKTRRIVDSGRGDSEAPLWEGERSCRYCHKPEENIYHSQRENFGEYFHNPGDDAYHERRRTCFYCDRRLPGGRWDFVKNLNDKQLPDEQYFSPLHTDEQYFSPLHIHF